MQGAKQRTNELLGKGNSNREDLKQDEHRRRLEFVRRRWKLTSLIAILGGALEDFTDTGKNDETLAGEEVPAGAAAPE